MAKQKTKKSKIRTKLTKRSFHPMVPNWVCGLYIAFTAATLTWTFYMALTLPTRHQSDSWDVAWVGVDILLLTMLLLTAIFAHFKSKWIIMTAMATSTLLIVDAWFDIWNEKAGAGFNQAIGLAIFIEIPLAVLTFLIAYKVIARRTH